MPFGFGMAPVEPLSIRRARFGAKTCRALADGYLAEAISSGDETFLEMALQAERDACAHERVIRDGGLMR